MYFCLSNKTIENRMRKIKSYIKAIIKILLIVGIVYFIAAYVALSNQNTDFACDYFIISQICMLPAYFYAGSRMKGGGYPF